VDTEQLVAQYLAERKKLQDLNGQLMGIANRLDGVAAGLKDDDLFRGVVGLLNRAATRLRKWQGMSPTTELGALSELSLPPRVKKALDDCHSLQRGLADLYRKIPHPARQSVPGPDDPL
jgi:hypothetical protein